MDQATILDNQQQETKKDQSSNLELSQEKANLFASELRELVKKHDVSLCGAFMVETENGALIGETTLVDSYKPLNIQMLLSRAASNACSESVKVMTAVLDQMKNQQEDN